MERKLDVLIDARTISNRVAELGREISRDYQGRHPLLVGVLKGAVVFLSDLMRSLTVLVEIDFMAVSSYGYSTTSSGVVRILKDLEKSLEGKDVLIVEDIVDTGLTDKPERRRVEFTADYCGFVIPVYFVVGYGLDYNEKYRHLPDLCILKGEEE